MQTKHEHPEAFKIMTYSCGLHTERIWNSRDGVTPFIVECLHCARDSQHVEWQRDMYNPYFKPAVGSRIFCDLTIERHRDYVKNRFVGATKEHLDDIVESHGSVEALMDLIIAEERSHGSVPPDLIVVGEEIKEAGIQ